MKKITLLLLMSLMLFSLAAFTGTSNNFSKHVQLNSSNDSTLLLEKMDSNLTSDTSLLVKSTEEVKDGIRTSFKKAMDNYEAFYKTFNEFMKEYKKNPTDLKIIKKYGKMLKKSKEVDKLLATWDEKKMTKEEFAYYLKVTTRVMKQLVNIDIKDKKDEN